MNYLIPLSIVSTALAAQAVETRLQDGPPGVKAAIKAELDGGRIDEIDREESGSTIRFADYPSAAQTSIQQNSRDERRVRWKSKSAASW